MELTNTQKIALIASVMVIVFLIGLFIGFFPKNMEVKSLKSANTQMETRVTRLEQELETANIRLRLANLRDQLTMLHLEVLNNNYGNSIPMSTDFFDKLRELTYSVKDPTLKSPLETILEQRDSVTTSLAKADPKSATKIESLLLELHAASKKF